MERSAGKFVRIQEFERHSSLNMKRNVTAFRNSYSRFYATPFMHDKCSIWLYFCNSFHLRTSLKNIEIINTLLIFCQITKYMVI